MKDNLNKEIKNNIITNSKGQHSMIMQIGSIEYRLLNEDEQTQKEIAKQLHISRSYVSRIEKRALAKVLREFIKNNKSL